MKNTVKVVAVLLVAAMLMLLAPRARGQAGPPTANASQRRAASVMQAATIAR